jgi:hypothetical protein
MTATTTEPLTADSIISGAQWRLFYTRNWPKGWYNDDITIDCDDERGNYVLPDEGQYRIGDLGYAAKSDSDAADILDTEPRELIPVHELYNAIMLKQTGYVIAFVKVPANRSEDFKAHIEAFGAEIV